MWEPGGSWGQVHLGAAMVWERTDRERGFFAGQAFTPIRIKDGLYDIRLASGELTSIIPNDPQMRFVGPGYAMTTHRSQSLTMEDNPIVILPSRQASQALAYVQVSRAVHGMTLITDDRRLLVQRLGVNDGMNLIAADHVRVEKPAVRPVEPTNEVTVAPLVTAVPKVAPEKEPPVAPAAPKVEMMVESNEPWDPSLLKPEPEKSFVHDRPYVREKSL